MKHSKTLLTLLVTILITTISYAQNGEMYLQGKWKASCPVEFTENVGILNCQICPIAISSDKKSIEIKDVEMDFGTDSIIINQNGTITTVPYAQNKDTHAINFTLNNKQYKLRVFMHNEQKILEDSDGLLLVLDKK